MDRYDAFILDQFGVMHNGLNGLDGAAALVEHLAQKKKKLIILSNTSAPAAKALERLPNFGFASVHFVDAVTSGEEASRYILQEYGNTDRPQKALMFTWDTTIANNPRLTAPPEAFLEQCGNVQVATSVEDADFLLLHGSEVWYQGRDHDEGSDESSKVVSLLPYIEEGDFTNVDPILKACLEAGLPAVCANPDFIVQMPSGDGVAYMPGKIAQRYTDHFGGTCLTFGKPQVEHFLACLRKLGYDQDKSGIKDLRVAHVGDSLHHDIVGATQAGIPTVFITSGIHKAALGTQFGELPSEEALEQLYETELADHPSIRPTHVVPAFRL